METTNRLYMYAKHCGSMDGNKELVLVGRKQGGDFVGYPEEVNYAFIAQKCRALRKGRGLTQKQVAEAMAVSGAYVGYLERNEKKPSVEMLVKLCLFYSIKMDHLFQEALPQHMYMLNDHERELMENHRVLGPAVRDSVASLVRKMAHRAKLHTP